MKRRVIILIASLLAYAAVSWAGDIGTFFFGVSMNTTPASYEAYNVWNGSAFESYKVWNGSAFEDYNVRSTP